MKGLNEKIITFYEAIEQLKKGTEVRFYDKSLNFYITFSYGSPIIQNLGDVFSMKDLIEGKWAIVKK